jgi:hypothetical protein
MSWTEIPKTIWLETEEDYIINFNSQPPSTAGATWTQCAREGEQCSFSGRREVRYGVDGKGFITKVAENSVSCNDGPFGAPTTNYENFCFYSSLTTTGSITVGTGPSTPTPTPAPTPSPTPTPAPSPTPAPAPSGSAGPRVSSFTNSGPINAQSGQVISGMKISNPNGACITVNGVSNVIIRDSQIGPCGQEAVSVGNGSRNITIEYNSINDVYHGIRNRYSYSVNTNNNIIRNVRQSGEDYRHAIEYSWMEGGTVDGNDMKGTFPSDVISMFESNNIRLTNNQFDVQILEVTGAPFTMGDSINGPAGHDNYVAGNIVRHTGNHSLPGVFGSSGNTVFEYNCFPRGMQAKEYNGKKLIGVTIRKNVIGPGNPPTIWQEDWQPPIGQQVSGWDTNVFSSDCSKIPQ